MNSRVKYQGNGLIGPRQLGENSPVSNHDWRTLANENKRLCTDILCVHRNLELKYGRCVGAV